MCLPILNMLMCALKIIYRILATLIVMLEGISRLILTAVYNTVSMVMTLVVLMPNILFMMTAVYWKCATLCGGRCSAFGSQGKTTYCFVLILIVYALIIVNNRFHISDKIMQKSGYQYQVIQKSSLLSAKSPTLNLPWWQKSIPPEYRQKWNDQTRSQWDRKFTSLGYNRLHTHHEFYTPYTYLEFSKLSTYHRFNNSYPDLNSISAKQFEGQQIYTARKNTHSSQKINAEIKIPISAYSKWKTKTDTATGDFLRTSNFFTKKNTNKIISTLSSPHTAQKTLKTSSDTCEKLVKIIDSVNKTNIVTEKYLIPFITKNKYLMDEHGSVKGISKLSDDVQKHKNVYSTRKKDHKELFTHLLSTSADQLTINLLNNQTNEIFIESEFSGTGTNAITSNDKNTVILENMFSLEGISKSYFSEVMNYTNEIFLYSELGGIETSTITSNKKSTLTIDELFLPLQTTKSDIKQTAKSDISKFMDEKTEIFLDSEFKLTTKSGGTVKFIDKTTNMISEMFLPVETGSPYLNQRSTSTEVYDNINLENVSEEKKEDILMTTVEESYELNSETNLQTISNIKTNLSDFGISEIEDKGSAVIKELNIEINKKLNCTAIPTDEYRELSIDFTKIDDASKQLYTNEEILTEIFASEVPLNDIYEKYNKIDYKNRTFFNGSKKSSDIITHPLISTSEWDDHNVINEIYLEVPSTKKTMEKTVKDNVTTKTKSYLNTASHNTASSNTNLSTIDDMLNEINLPHNRPFTTTILENTERIMTSITGDTIFIDNWNLLKSDQISTEEVLKTEEFDSLADDYIDQPLIEERNKSTLINQTLVSNELISNEISDEIKLPAVVSKYSTKVLKEDTIFPITTSAILNDIVSIIIVPTDYSFLFTKNIEQTNRMSTVLSNNTKILRNFFNINSDSDESIGIEVHTTGKYEILSGKRSTLQEENNDNYLPLFFDGENKTKFDTLSKPNNLYFNETPDNDTIYNENNAILNKNFPTISLEIVIDDSTNKLSTTSSNEIIDQTSKITFTNGELTGNQSNTDELFQNHDNNDAIELTSIIPFLYGKQIINKTNKYSSSNHRLHSENELNNNEKSVLLIDKFRTTPEIFDENVIIEQVSETPFLYNNTLNRNISEDLLTKHGYTSEVTIDGVKKGVTFADKSQTKELTDIGDNIERDSEIPFLYMQLLKKKTDNYLSSNGSGNSSVALDKNKHRTITSHKSRTENHTEIGNISNDFIDQTSYIPLLNSGYFINNTNKQSILNGRVNDQVTVIDNYKGGKIINEYRTKMVTDKYDRIELVSYIPFLSGDYNKNKTNNDTIFISLVTLIDNKNGSKILDESLKKEENEILDEYEIEYVTAVPIHKYILFNNTNNQVSSLNRRLNKSMTFIGTNERDDVLNESHIKKNTETLFINDSIEKRSEIPLYKIFFKNNTDEYPSSNRRWNGIVTSINRDKSDVIEQTSYIPFEYSDNLKSKTNENHSLDDVLSSSIPFIDSNKRIKLDDVSPTEKQTETRDYNYDLIEFTSEIPLFNGEYFINKTTEVPSSNFSMSVVTFFDNKEKNYTLSHFRKGILTKISDSSDVIELNSEIPFMYYPLNRAINSATQLNYQSIEQRSGIPLLFEGYFKNKTKETLQYNHILGSSFPMSNDEVKTNHEYRTEEEHMSEITMPNGNEPKFEKDTSEIYFATTFINQMQETSLELPYEIALKPIAREKDINKTSIEVMKELNLSDNETNPKETNIADSHDKVHSTLIQDNEILKSKRIGNFYKDTLAKSNNIKEKVIRNSHTPTRPRTRLYKSKTTKFYKLKRRNQMKSTGNSNNKYPYQFIDSKVFDDYFRKEKITLTELKQNTKTTFKTEKSMVLPIFKMYKMDKGSRRFKNASRAGDSNINRVVPKKTKSSETRNPRKTHIPGNIMTIPPKLKRTRKYRPTRGNLKKGRTR